LTTVKPAAGLSAYPTLGFGAAKGTYPPFLTYL
jgi:hypothetical protein